MGCQSWVTNLDSPCISIALRVSFWANPRKNDTSNPIAPVNRAQENEHLSAVWANSLIGPLRKVQKTAKIALFGHLRRPILTFRTPYSLPKHPRWPYLLEKGGRSAERLQTLGFKHLIFFPKKDPFCIFGKNIRFFKSKVCNLSALLPPF